MLFSRKSGEENQKKPGILERMKRALGATKATLVARIESVLASRAELDDAALEELEGVLLGADLGVGATNRVMGEIRGMVGRKEISSREEARAALRRVLLGILKSPAGSDPSPAAGAPRVWMIVGVNGTGKTTTIGKLAARLGQEGGSVLVCAADTFRPAAIEQLETWVQRAGAELIKSRPGADPSAVLHDALEAAAARKRDFLLVDTAGRLHTRSNLMQELEKMRRVAGRRVQGAPHEVLLVIDATTGQNGLAQAREFLKLTGVTGLIVTKLDGTAKGGVLFAITQELKIPVRFIGVGETLEDLLDFSPATFVDSLFG